MDIITTTDKALDTIKEMSAYWKEVSTRYDAAVQKKLDTRKAFNDDADRRDQIIRDKIADLQKELDGIHEQAVKVGGQYGNALSSGNQKEADRLQAEADSITLKEFQVGRRKETIAKTKILYDQMLFNAAVEAYNETDQEYDLMNDRGARFEELIEKLILDLGQLKKTVHAKREVYSTYDDQLHDRMIKRMQQGSAGAQ